MTYSAVPSPSMEEQMKAWQRYVVARQKSDETLALEDGRAAAEAWVGFLNVYLPENEQLPERRSTGGNVARFPIHKTRAPGGQG